LSFLDVRELDQDGIVIECVPVVDLLGVLVVVDEALHELEGKLPSLAFILAAMR